jgi:O-antigen/teichoic acid export membrane protein
MKRKSVGINAILNVVRQICVIIFPLITFPYISRVLQVENYGKINFSNSIIQYFLLLATLGLTNYAIREGSYLRNNKKDFNKFANQVFTISIITTLISYLLLIIIIILWPKLHSYWPLLAIQGLTIFLNIIGVDWINYVYEDYLYLTLRFVIVQVFSIIAMFVFVKKPEDYLIFAGIQTFAQAGANITNVFHVRQYVKLRLVKRPNVKKHIVPMLTMFANTISVQIYYNADTTLLGIFKNDIAVGCYSVAAKIYAMVKQVLNAVLVVTIPRIVSYLRDNKMKEYNQLLDKTFHFILSLLLPAITGFFVLSYDIMILIGGEQYINGHWALKILSVALFGNIFASYFNNVILVPNRKEKYFLIATITAAIVNIGLNMIFIPIWSYNGAAVTTVIAEFIVMGFGVYFSRGLYNFKINFRDIISTVVGCCFIVVICLAVQQFVYNSIVRIIICVPLSIVFYGIIMLVSKNRLGQVGLGIIKRVLHIKSK